MNQRQIPFLHWQRLADGTWAAHWKPSRSLRAQGWTNRKLGTAPAKTGPAARACIQAALELNETLATWRQAGTLAAPEPAAKVWTFSDLAQAYRSSTEWAEELAPATRAEYGTRLRQLEEWARDGAGNSIPFRAIDQAMVMDLKAALLPVSVYRCAGTLRVLRLLLRWGKRHGAHDATQGVKIPTTPSRQQKLDWQQVEAIAAATAAAGHATAALAIRVGFWSMQRQGDLLAFNRLSWRKLEAIDPRDRAVLANPKGEVWGFRLRQNKTGAHVDAPMPPFLHADIWQAFDHGQWLLADNIHPDQAMPAFRLQRQIRPFLRAAAPDHQFRDLRRSGMAWFKDMGALPSNIFAISGHAVLGKRSIVDTYMPPDTRAAAAAVAQALRTMAEIDQRNRDNG